MVIRATVGTGNLELRAYANAKGSRTPLYTHTFDRPIEDIGKDELKETLATVREKAERAFVRRSGVRGYTLIREEV